MFRGTFTAIVTPFKDDKIDFESFNKLIDFQIDEGIDGIVFCGTTGENPTLTKDEFVEVANFTVKTVNKRVPVIIGTGTNSTIKTIENTQIAYDSGANGVLVVCPYYNKPTQEGLYRHFESVATTVDIPLIVYNIQSRTGINLSTDVLVKLSEYKNIVAVKEASGNINQMMDVINKTDEKFSVLSGDDGLTLPLVLMGGDGVISTSSNVIPKKMTEMVKLALEGKINEARQIHYEYLDLMKGLFIETNPVPVKYALHLMGLCEDKVRLPLYEMDKSNKKFIKELIKKYKLS